MTPQARLEREERRLMRARTFNEYGHFAQRIAMAIGITLVSVALASILHAATRAPF